MDFQQLMARMVELDQPVQESDKKASKDYDGDGEVESGKDEYMGSRDKAIKKATGNDDDETKESLDQLANEVQQEMDECGMPGMSNMPNGMMGMRDSQPDSVTMNISMNGAGSGGIRDLMDILRNLEDDHHDHGDMPDLDIGRELDKPSLIVKKEPILGDEFANSPDPVIAHGNEFPSDTGNDMHRPKDSFSDKPYRGDNPMALETLKNRLDNLYQEVKSR